MKEPNVENIRILKLEKGEQPDFLKLIKHDICTIVHGHTIEAKMTNSKLWSIPAFDISSLVSAHEPLFITATRVRIEGESQEPTHHHTANLIANILAGEGILRAKGKDNEEHRQVVLPDDIIVIPAGAYHFFDPTPSGFIEYQALEFGKIVDYQKHYE